MNNNNNKLYSFMKLNTNELFAIAASAPLLALFIYLSAALKVNFITLIFILLVFLYIIMPFKISFNSFLTGLWLITLFFVFLGSNVVSIPFMGFHIFPGRVLLIIYWAIFIVTVILKKGKIQFASSAFKPFLLFLIIWIIWDIATFTWASSRTDVIRNLVFLFQGFSIIFFTLYTFNTEKKLDILYSFWVMILIFMVIIGFWENITASHLPASTVSLEYGYRPWQLDIPSAVFTNPNDYATFLVLSVPFILVLIKYSKKFIYKMLALLVSAAVFYLIVITESRANMVAFLLIFFAWILLNFKNIKVLLSRGVYKLIFAGILAIGITVALMPIFGDSNMSISGKLINEVKSLSEKTSDGSINVRTNLLKNGMIFLWNSAMIGVGGGNVEWHQRNNQIYPTQGITNIHNWWGELLVNYGIVIFVLYMVFYLSLLKYMLKVYNHSKSITHKLISESVLLSFIAFPLASTSSSSVFAEITVWLMYATAIALYTVYRIKGD